MQITFPHTIENGHGETLTFVGIRSDAEGEFVEVRNIVAEGSGPPMHVHHRQTESLTVERGRMGYQCLGGETQRAEAGETVCFEAGVAHRFWAEGGDLECTGWVRPPDNLVYFLTEIYRSTRENGDAGRPSDFDAAYLMHRYRNEFDMPGIPAFVKRVIFPTLRLIGRATGKFERFADAPPPLD